MSPLKESTIDGYKQSDVGVIPNDWTTNYLGDICTLVNGRGFKPHEWSREGLPIIRIQNLNGSDEFNFYEGHYNPKILIKNGQLLFAWSGSRGTSFGPHIWYGEDALLNYHTWKMEIKSGIEPDYFYHALMSLTRVIENSAHGASALVHTQMGEMKKFIVPIPASNHEQTAIANALSDVDALIQELEKLIAKKQAIKTATMQQLLTGRTRLPQFAHHPDGRKKGYKPSELGEIPEDWEVKTIFELGRVSTGGTPSTSSAEYWNGDVPWITPTDISHSKNIYSSERKISQKGLQSIRPLPANTVLVTCIASIGKNAILRRDGACNQQINAVIPYEHIDVDFLFYAIELSSDRLKASAGITATLIVSKALFEEFQLVIPANLEEQEAISVILNEMDEDIQSLEKRLNKTRQIKQGMMQELLTGKTRLGKPAGAA